MNQEFLSISQEENFKSKKPKPIKSEERRLSAEARLLITTLVLFFVALNIWGYYFYKKGILGISADITYQTPTAPPKLLEKSDAVYMIPGM